MPRQSADFLATVPYTAPSAQTPRLKPPASMSEAGRAVFLALVMGSKPDAFQPTDLPLLARYAEASALAEKAEAELAKRPLVKGKPNPWASILVQSVKTVSMMAMRLRLSPQARAPNNPTRRTPPMSYYERQDLEQQLSRDEDTQQ